MFRSHPLAARALCFIFIPLLAVLIGTVLYLRGSLPTTDGRSISTSVRQPVTLARDANGVVFIDAQNDTDAFFALGYAHAQDRLWQLELQRRIASGRLSEVFGRNSVQQDIWMRTLGLYEAARQSWPQLSDAARQSLTAYTRGVNAWLQTSRVLPPEFIATGVRPEPWSEIDSLAWAKVFALSLSRNFRTEIGNFVLAQHLNANQMRELVQTSATDKSVPARPQDLADVEGGRKLLALQQELQEVLKIGGPYVGSNAWAISGRCAAGGHAILANDAHLELQIPSLWYVARLKGDRLDAAGMTLVGLPVIVFGRNRNIAWGGTNMLADVQDLYLEEINPQQPTQYRQNGAWQDFETRAEIIKVRADFPASFRSAAPPVQIHVRKTSRGPIISDVVGAVEQPISLRWTALEAGDTSYEALYRLNYAQDWDTFKAALRLYVTPALNMLYADTSGNIGFLGIGRIPVRKQGEGRTPAAGWDEDYRWTGYIPFEELPQQYNPEKCYLESANEKNVDSQYPYFISDDWAPPFRAQRIKQLLDEQVAKASPISPDYVMKMQADSVDLGALKLADFLSRLSVTGEQRKQAVGYLSNWHGSMARDSQAGALFYVWSRILRQQLFAARLTGDWNKPQQSAELKAASGKASYDQVLSALTQSDNWCDRTAADGERSCHRIMAASLDEALAELRKLQGSNMEKWRWGAVHSTLYSHNPFSRIESLAPIFERRIANGGSSDTINAAHSSYREAVGYEQTMGAAFRQIMQMNAQAPVHYYMNSTGQSGNVLSPHYDDMVQPFRDVKYFDLEKKPAAKSKGAVVLNPE